MKADVRDLGGDCGKGFVVGVIRVDRQFQIGFIVESRRWQLLINDHWHDSVVQNGGQRRFHLFAVIFQRDAGKLTALRLANVIGISQRIAAPHGRAGKDFDAIVFLTVHDGAIQRFPAVTGAEHGGLRVAEHDQRDISGAVCGVVSLHLQIPRIGIGTGGDLHHPGVLHGSGIIPFCLLLFLPFGVVLRFPAYDLFQICVLTDT